MFIADHNDADDNDRKVDDDDAVDNFDREKYYNEDETNPKTTSTSNDKPPRLPDRRPNDGSYHSRRNSLPTTKLKEEAFPPPHPPILLNQPIISIRRKNGISTSIGSTNGGRCGSCNTNKNNGIMNNGVKCNKSNNDDNKKNDNNMNTKHKNNVVISSPTNINMISSPRSTRRSIQRIQQYHRNNNASSHVKRNAVTRKQQHCDNKTTSPISTIISNIKTRHHQQHQVNRLVVVWYHHYHHYYHQQLVKGNNHNPKTPFTSNEMKEEL